MRFLAPKFDKHMEEGDRIDKIEARAAETMEHHYQSCATRRRRRAKSSRKAMRGERNTKTSLLGKVATSFSSRTAMIFGLVVVAVLSVVTPSIMGNSEPSSATVNAFVLPSSSPLKLQMPRHRSYPFRNTWTAGSLSTTSSTKRNQQRRDDSLEDDRKRKGGNNRDNNGEHTKPPGGGMLGRLKFGKLIKSATPSLPSTSKRHYSDLKMREAEELGGIARSERYSSR